MQRKEGEREHAGGGSLGSLEPRLELELSSAVQSHQIDPSLPIKWIIRGVHGFREMNVGARARLSGNGCVNPPSDSWIHLPGGREGGREWP